MRKFLYSISSILRAFPLELLLVLALPVSSLLGMGPDVHYAYEWLPLIFVLMFAANQFRPKGWWGSCAYILAFMLLIPVWFMSYDEANLNFPLMYCLALAVFVSVGEWVGRKEWTKRVLHRSLALLQAFIAGLAYLFVVMAVVTYVDKVHSVSNDGFYFEVNYPRLEAFLVMFTFLIFGFVLCWRLWAQTCNGEGKDEAEDGFEGGRG